MLIGHLNLLHSINIKITHSIFLKDNIFIKTFIKKLNSEILPIFPFISQAKQTISPIPQHFTVHIYVSAMLSSFFQDYLLCNYLRFDTVSVFYLQQEKLF